MLKVKMKINNREQLIYINIKFLDNKSHYMIEKLQLVWYSMEKCLYKANSVSISLFLISTFQD